MRIYFRCRHSQAMHPDKPSPRCIQCGETQIAGTRGVPAPRITGHGSGPTVTPQDLDAVAVTLAKTPLPLKDDYAHS